MDILAFALDQLRRCVCGGTSSHMGVNMQYTCELNHWRIGVFA